MLPFYSEDVRNARRRTIFFEAKATLLCVQRVDRRICPGGSPNYFCLQIRAIENQSSLLLVAKTTPISSTGWGRARFVGTHQLSKTGIDHQQKCSDSALSLLVNDLHVAGAWCI